MLLYLCCFRRLVGFDVLQDQPLDYSSSVVKTLQEIKRGDHLSWNVEMFDYLPSTDGFEYPHHHVLVSRVYRVKSKLQVFSFSSNPTEDAVISLEMVPIAAKLSSGQITKHEFVDIKSFDTHLIIQRAEDRLGDPGVCGSVYDLFTNNCEQMVTLIKGGVAFSKQSGVYYVPQ